MVDVTNGFAVRGSHIEQILFRTILLLVTLTADKNYDYCVAVITKFFNKIEAHLFIKNTVTSVLAIIVGQLFMFCVFLLINPI